MDWWEWLVLAFAVVGVGYTVVWIWVFISVPVVTRFRARMQRQAKRERVLEIMAWDDGFKAGVNWDREADERQPGNPFRYANWLTDAMELQMLP